MNEKKERKKKIKTKKKKKIRETKKKSLSARNKINQTEIKKPTIIIIIIIDNPVSN